METHEQPERDEPQREHPGTDQPGTDELETERELRELRRDLSIPSRGAGVYVMLAFMSAAAAAWGVWPILTGPLGMVLGLIGHLKGARYGFASAVVAGVATVIGMSVVFLLFNPMEN